MLMVHISQTVFEIILIGLIILGFIYEPKITKWEHRQKRKIRIFNNGGAKNGR